LTGIGSHLDWLIRTPIAGIEGLAVLIGGDDHMAGRVQAIPADGGEHAAIFNLNENGAGMTDFDNFKNLDREGRFVGHNRHFLSA
jgi:hypothetical protein